MPLGESIVERAERTPAGYAAKVWTLAGIYVALNAVCLAVIALVVWRGRLLVALAQRSNVETLVLAIVLALALYYLVSTFRGCVGALRMLLLNLPSVGLPALVRSAHARTESRKQRALPEGGKRFSVHFDKAILAPERSEPISWEIADEFGSLGRIRIDLATATVEPTKSGLNNSLLAFLFVQILAVLERRGEGEALTVAFWSTIDEEGSAVFRSTVRAFAALAARLGGGPAWPAIALHEAEIHQIGTALADVVPALRNEAFLPDVEYEVAYTIPVLPEPLAFLQLRRTERRADPVLTMGYALVVMLMVLLSVVLLILFPPWVPSQ